MAEHLRPRLLQYHFPSTTSLLATGPRVNVRVANSLAATTPLCIVLAHSRLYHRQLHYQLLPRELLTHWRSPRHFAPAPHSQIFLPVGASMARIIHLFHSQLGCFRGIAVLLFTLAHGTSTQTAPEYPPHPSCSHTWMPPGTELERRSHLFINPMTKMYDSQSVSHPAVTDNRVSRCRSHHPRRTFNSCIRKIL